MSVEHRTIAASESGMRLDRWFKQHYPQLTHGRLEKLLRTGQVRVNGGRVEAKHRLEAGASVRVPPLPAATAVREGREKLQSSHRLRDWVLAETDDLIVLNKPSGLAVQGGSKTSVHVDGLLHQLVDDGAEVPRLVHRLDRDTSGVLVVAKTAPAARALAQAFASKAVRKLYLALVVGVPQPQEGLITSYLGKEVDAYDYEIVQETASGKKSVSDFRTLSFAPSQVALLALQPITGRTHQLRVHCQQLGCPIAGDEKYGYPTALQVDDYRFTSLHLHAFQLEISLPDKPVLQVQAPLPPHILTSMARFGLAAPAKRWLEFSTEEA